MATGRALHTMMACFGRRVKNETRLSLFVCHVLFRSSKHKSGVKLC
jgi:hypothetical protein